MKLFRDQNKLRSFEKHLEKQNGEHNLCHVCEHILEGTLAKGVFSTSTSSLSSDSTTSFALTMKLLSNQLSQSALEGLSTKTCFETHELISSVNTTKKIKDVKKEGTAILVQGILVQVTFVQATLVQVAFCPSDFSPSSLLSK